MRAIPRLLRARRAGPAIVEEARPPERGAGRRGRPEAYDEARRPVVSETVDTILKASPSRVLLVAGRRAAWKDSACRRRSCSRRSRLCSALVLIVETAIVGGSLGFLLGGLFLLAGVLRLALVLRAR